MSLTFGTEGAAWNHLLDLDVASLCLFGVWLFKREEKASYLATAALTVVVLAGLGRTLVDFGREITQPSRSKYEEVLEALGEIHQPILSEDPFFPLLAGRRPYIVDPFSVQVLGRRDPALLEPLKKRLREQKFAVLLLQYDPRTERGRQWYTLAHFGPSFVPELERNYQFVAEIHKTFIYLPRKR